MEAKNIIDAINAGEKRISAHVANHDEAIALAHALRGALAAARVEYYHDRIEVWDDFHGPIAERWMVEIKFVRYAPLAPPVRVCIRYVEVVGVGPWMVHPVTATLTARFGRVVTRRELAAAIATELGYCITAAAPAIPPRGESPSRASFDEGRDPRATSNEWTLHVATSDVGTACRIDCLRAE